MRVLLFVVLICCKLVIEYGQTISECELYCKMCKPSRHISCGEHPLMSYEAITKIQPAFTNFRASRMMLPYLAQVSHVPAGQECTRCAGTIVGKRHILTTSDCVPPDTDMNNYRVMINGYFWGKGEKVKVANIFRQKKGEFKEKLALIMVENDIAPSFNETADRYVNRVCVGQSPQLYTSGFNLVADISSKFITLGWYHQGVISTVPFIDVMSSEQLESHNHDYWIITGGIKELQPGTPLIETNLLKAYVRGVYIGSAITRENQPFFLSIEENGISEFMNEHIELENNH